MTALTRALTAALTALLVLTAAPAHGDEQPRVSAVRDRTGYDFRNYLAVGDSITYGVGTTDPATKAYPEQANVRSVGVGATCVSDACGPYSFRQAVLPKIRALGHQPRTLVFHYGVNDLAFGISAEQLIQRTETMRRRLERLGYRVVLGTVIPSPADSTWTVSVGEFSPDGTTVQHNRLLYNRWIRHEGRPFVDYAAALECRPGRVQCPGLTESNDCHVNDEGARLMAVVLRDWIRADRRARR